MEYTKTSETVIPTPVSALRVGGHVILRGDKPCRITAMTTAKMMSTESGRVWADTDGRHLGIWCNACDQPLINGNRYVCLDCADYDLCETCEEQNAHGHEHLTFAKIRDSRYTHVDDYRLLGRKKKKK